MTFLIDRRANSKNKSAVNRQRFLRRYRRQIRDAMRKNLAGRSITDTERGEKISIPARDTNEPVFHHTRSGRSIHIFPGNREFQRGDHLPRPEDGGGGSGAGQASDRGESMDDFVFEISHDEFLDLLFEDMVLPNLTKRQLSGSDDFKLVRSGFTTAGAPSSINIIRSLRTATSRRIAIGAKRRRELRELEKQLAAMPEPVGEQEVEKRRQIEGRIEELREQLGRIPFLDEIDIRYHRNVEEPVPHSKAVMFCLMDVSGSMDQRTKDLAKRFFILLYLFLNRNYQKTEAVFIRHHTSAQEVDEETFFYSRESGGTVVSSALELMDEIIAARYPVSEWNIYGAQASDGDNWPDDSQRCLVCIDKMLSKLQYYAYIEISEQSPRTLWQTYIPVQEKYSKVFAMKNIMGPEDIYPVFHDLFKKVIT